ncbi:HIRAN domain [Slackia heliotrinireducens]|jgi:hypothetical protein|uniref:HIRAN domain-containing protein n=1 Tax=Slackia heliotrinireducens (strain ATCC 29202 / DSM 20476 / NCTC 11029 / RHS 1) TaxID=471855 RepID=C7N3E8_SLAHD|nr:HIRAN domain-containing protein [Slackia heliotrinireducens]ACV23671.1 HIRAN domain-containing protein [Slackia heliotrinireducens DSM 20476]VEH03210.1 HIRAN domain [Slackia heliotrinireducens]
MPTDEQKGNALAPIASTELGSLLDSGHDLGIPMPYASRIVLLEETCLAGTRLVHNADQVAKKLKEGQELTLQRDVANLRDSWAIRVMAGQNRLGYVSVDCNEILARLMDAGKSLGARFVRYEKAGSRIYMEVYLDD